MSEFDREQYEVRGIETQRKGEEPYSGDPYAPKRVKIEVAHHDGDFRRTYTVEYSIEGSTAVFSRNGINTEYLRERHVTATLVADEAVGELPFVQAVQTLADAVPEVSADE